MEKLGKLIRCLSRLSSRDEVVRNIAQARSSIASGLTLSLLRQDITDGITCQLFGDMTAIRSSSRNLKTSLACACRRPSTRWFCAATEKPSAGAGSYPARAATQERTRKRWPRLQTPWCNHVVCGHEHAGRLGDFPLRAASSPYGMARFPAPDQSRDAQRQGVTSDLRQLRDAQASESHRVAGETSALPCPFHANVRFLAQHGRALLPQHLD